MSKKKILLFAKLAELIGKSELTWQVNEQTTASDLIKELKTKFPQIEPLAKNLIVAVDTRQIELKEKIGQVQDEIAIFPPVSGG